jgi:hypothetical protein
MNSETIGSRVVTAFVGLPFAFSGVRYLVESFWGARTDRPGRTTVAKVQASDFVRLKALSLRQLLSAHGEPPLNGAHEAVSATSADLYDV